MIGLQAGDTLAISITTGGSIQWSASGLNSTTASVFTPETFSAGTVAPSAITTILNPTGTNQFNITELNFYNAGTTAQLVVYRQPNGGAQVISWSGTMSPADTLTMGPGGWQHFNSAGQIVTGSAASSGDTVSAQYYGRQVWS